MNRSTQDKVLRKYIDALDYIIIMFISVIRIVLEVGMP
jgi:hypothetical protein